MCSLLLILFTSFCIINATHELQCLELSHVGRYFYDSCEQRCECIVQQPGSLLDIKCFREREDFSCMSDTRRQRFIQAYLKLSNPDSPMYGQMRYLISKHSIDFATIHSVRWFLPWHRAYLLELENLLRHIDCKITIPYWSFSDRPTDPFPFFPFGNQGIGDNGNPNNGLCVDNGPFAFPWIPPSKTSCLTRNFETVPILPTLTQLNSILALGSTSYTSFSNQLQYSYHNGVHVTIGGDASTMISPVDPIFFLIHGNVDRAWDMWQKMSTSKLNAYGSFSKTSPMPYMFNGITFENVKSLEASGIRYVKTLSSELGKDHSTSQTCGFVMLTNGWFSLSGIEKQIVGAPQELLLNVSQISPVTLSSLQQESWLQKMPASIQPEIRILMKQSEQEAKTLTEKLKKVIGRNFISNKSFKNEPGFQSGMNLDELVSVLKMTPDCPSNVESCDVDLSLTPNPTPWAPSKSITQKPTTRAPILRPSKAPTQRPTTRSPTLRPTSRMPTQKPTSRMPTQRPSSKMPTLRPSSTMPTLRLS